MTITVATAAGGGLLPTLTRKIGWLCQTIRALAVFNALLTLWGFIHAWTTRAPYELTATNVFRLDVSGATAAQWNAVLAMSLVLWLFVAALAFCIWRLFSIYLKGEVLTAHAALWLRRIGVVGLLTILADFIERSAVIYALGAHLPASAETKHIFIGTEDFIHVILALMLIALGHIQKTAADIADEHAQIV